MKSFITSGSDARACLVLPAILVFAVRFSSVYLFQVSFLRQSDSGFGT